MHIVVGDFGRDGRCWFLLLRTIIGSDSLSRRLCNHLKTLYEDMSPLFSDNEGCTCTGYEQFEDQNCQPPDCGACGWSPVRFGSLTLTKVHVLEYLPEFEFKIRLPIERNVKPNLICLGKLQCKTLFV